MQIETGGRSSGCGMYLLQPRHARHRLAAARQRDLPEAVVVDAVEAPAGGVLLRRRAGLQLLVPPHAEVPDAPRRDRALVEVVLDPLGVQPRTHFHVRGVAGRLLEARRDDLAPGQQRGRAEAEGAGLGAVEVHVALADGDLL